MLQKNLPDQFMAFIQKEGLLLNRTPWLLAVSGGLDSVVLAALCSHAGIPFCIAHANFQLRGEESERDERFVKLLAERYNVKMYHKRFDTKDYVRDRMVSVQVAARELRYAWFEELRKSLGDQAAIATAHHRDDNVETQLMNFFKGTGIAGLRGILPGQGHLVRPLLFAGKEELRQYANEKGLEWMEDSSNESDKYTRNYFRHQVVPLLKQVYPGVESNLADNLQRFREIEELYQQSITQHKKKLLSQRGADWYIPVLKLKQCTPIRTILYEIIKDYGFSPSQAEEVIGILDSESGRFVQSADYRIIKHRSWLIITPQKSIVPGLVLVEGEGDTVFSDGVLRVTRSKMKKIPEQSGMAFLDAKHIHFPLLLRPPRQGDYFYPLGMKKKKKKINRFLIDQKLSRAEKEKIWVVEMDKKIIWVVGHRIDDRFRVTDATTQVIQLNWES